MLNIFEGAAIGYFVGKTGAYAARVTGYVEGDEAVHLSGICRTTGIGVGAITGPVMFKIGYDKCLKDKGFIEMDTMQ